MQLRQDYAPPFMSLLEIRCVTHPLSTRQHAWGAIDLQLQARIAQA